jgi:hypothetical protein
LAERVVVVVLLLVILVLNWAGFVALDKKIEQALKQQGEINQSSYLVNKEQSESIRLLKTDTNILMNIAVNGEFTKEEE